MAKAAITPALSRAESRSELETCVDVWDAAEISIPDRFRQIAKAHPRQIALSGSIWRPDYAELDRVTDQIGHFLGTTLSNQIGGRVALLLRHDVPQLAAALAVLKAGKMVVVLNPADPPARLRQILEDAEPEAILTDNTHGKLASEIVMAGQTVLHFEKCQATNGTDAPAVSIRPEDAAWLIYTSGTTGKPKGVVQTHRNIVHNVMRISEGMDLQPSDRLLLLNSPGGGLGVSTAWCALLNGATLFPFPIMERGLAGLKTWMRENEISVWVSSTSVFRGFVKTLEVADRFPAVRLVRFGSETATAAEANAVWKHFPEECVLFNSLSASETGNLLQHKFTREDLLEETRLPVGWPARGVEVLLLDEQGREVAAGETGELVIRSRYLSPGYWRNQALTASRFSREADGLATFRSGDFGKRRADGALIFMDRQDARVKIHGYQVEMSEVEDVLRQQPDIENALVLACQVGEELQLVAHIVPRAGKSYTPASVREAVRRQLPPYMVPSYFHFWEQFPLTTNGKIDREKLRQTTVPMAVQEVAEPPATPTEELLAGIWQKVFNRGAIGRNDDFYDLGGDSLHATVMAAQIHSVLGVEIHLNHLAAHSSLAQLAQFLDGLPRAGQTALPPLAKVSRDRPAPLSFIQERTWKYSRTPEGNLGYTMVGRQRITGPLNVEVLRETMNHLISRHESLRTTFDEVDGKPVQMAHPPGPVALTVLDFSGYADARQRADQLQREDIRRGFDIHQGPLMRFILVRLQENEHWLLRLTHHLVCDGGSWSIYFREFANVYEAKLNGRAPSFPAQEPLHYMDHAANERRVLNPEGKAYRDMVDWWERTLSGTLRARPLPSRRRKPFPAAKASSGHVWWGLDPAISARLNVITREQNVTYYTIRLAVFALLLAEHAKGDDLLIGTFATGRNRVETQNMFGDFANLVTLRLKCDQKQTFLQWLKQVDAKVSETRLYSAIPYEQLREELKKRNVQMPDPTAIFSVTSHTGTLRFGGLEMTWLERPMEHMPWGLSMTCDKFNDHQRNRLTFDPRTHHPERVHEMLKRYQQLLDIVSQHPDWTVERLLNHGRQALFLEYFKTPEEIGALILKPQPDIHLLPVGVLIPTRNSMAYLPRHLETMRPWLDAVQEIVVVDSASTDGTVEFLRENLPACKTRFFEHPPGLYQSWNFGIQQITAPYTYVSTVGDEMSPDGLAHLVDVAEGFACDVVISPPIFVNDAGAPVSANPWPIHEVISFWELEKETYLEGVRPYLIALSFLPFALLGSSASNLYRTRVLQKNPFPTGYGLNGDGAWGAFNLLNARLGITPRRISFFRRHEKSYLEEYETDEPEQRMLADSLKYLEKTLAARLELQAEAAALQLPEFVRLKMDYTRWRSELKRHRRHWLPWYFKSVAWRARTRRDIALEACRMLLKTASFVPPEMDLNCVGLMPAASQGTSLAAQTVRESV